MKRLAEIKGLRCLDINGTAVTNERVKELAGMKLRELIIPFKARTDRGLKHLLAATEPREKLRLRSWTITDAGLKELAGQRKLRSLDLLGRPITNKGLKALAGLNIESLDIGYTKVSDAGAPRGRA